MTTAMNLPHPRDQCERWRREWATILELVDEITPHGAPLVLTQDPPDP